MKKILVTGSNGYIAKHIILELYKRNYSVRGTVRDLKYSKIIQNDIEKQLEKKIDIEFVETSLDSDYGWEDAVKNCDVIMTDKIISLNDKVNKKKKLKSFKNFKVDAKTMSFAKKDAIFLHCLPRGNEVTEEVFLGRQSKVWQQALNRVYVQKSILLYCFDKLR